MNTEKESLFLSTLNKNNRDRISFELSSKKKRENAIMRFCHDAELIVDSKKLIEKYDKAENVKSYLNNANVYVLSQKYIDGIEMQTDNALQYAENEYSAVIMIGNDKCIIKSESESGSSEYFVLAIKP